MKRNNFSISPRNGKIPQNDAIITLGKDAAPRTELDHHGSDPRICNHAHDKVVQMFMLNVRGKKHEKSSKILFNLYLVANPLWPGNRNLPGLGNDPDSRPPPTSGNNPRDYQDPPSDKDAYP